VYQRNKSLTKGEIDAYWRLKKTTEEEHLVASSSSSPRSLTTLTSPRTIIQETADKESRELKRSNSLPVTDRKGNFLNIDTETAAKTLMTQNDWWTRSNWAFLNEPPVIAAEGPTYKYASQYHLTSFGSSKPDHLHGIST
ncbi:Dna-directed rna polymerase subunit beta, partial [Thalictrum thalictroides]